MKVIGYARVSTDEQAKSGLSMDEQVSSIRGYCTALDLKLDEVVQDGGVSAKNLRAQPGLSRILQMAERGEVGVLVVKSLDRASRNMRQALEMFDDFTAQGVRFVSIVEQIDSSTASGRLFRNILLSMGQHERERIGERTAAALRSQCKVAPAVSAISKHRIDEGKLACGQAPYGYRQKGRGWVEHDEEMEVVRFIRKRRAEGLSIRDIGDALLECGEHPRRGHVWQPTVLRRIAAADYY